MVPERLGIDNSTASFALLQCLSENRIIQIEAFYEVKNHYFKSDLTSITVIDPPSPSKKIASKVKWNRLQSEVQSSREVKIDRHHPFASSKWLLTSQIRRDSARIKSLLFLSGKLISPLYRVILLVQRVKNRTIKPWNWSACKPRLLTELVILRDTDLAPIQSEIIAYPSAAKYKFPKISIFNVYEDSEPKNVSFRTKTDRAAHGFSNDCKNTLQSHSEQCWIPGALLIFRESIWDNIKIENDFKTWHFRSIDSPKSMLYSPPPRDKLVRFMEQVWWFDSGGEPWGGGSGRAYFSESRSKKSSFGAIFEILQCPTFSFKSLESHDFRK